MQHLRTTGRRRAYLNSLLPNGGGGLQEPPLGFLRIPFYASKIALRAFAYS